MRLLHRSSHGVLTFTNDLHGSIPAYAILSHTWGKEEEEVTFSDIKNGFGQFKEGYKKIKFCGEQAARDGLQYFWVDTCCIDKANHAELQDAINSMFRWYRNAAKCYVYLSDVSSSSVGAIGERAQQTWDSEFSKSRWFTRGWTLQELLAPRLVHFFSCKGTPLGDKVSLQQDIHRITGISEMALRGEHQFQYNADEPFQWMSRRKTGRAEDKVYALLGILDISLSIEYDEGETKARERLREVLHKRNQCIRDLHSTDPRVDKIRIENDKGGLLEDAYRWIFDNSEYKTWSNTDQSPLLWIKGEPGKGKTMLLCGIINELSKPTASKTLLSYFFCQATDARINNAIAVIRGLLYMLIVQQPSLASHVQKKYDHAGRALFKDTNAWVALSETLNEILQDPSLNNAYLVVDALDECVTGLPELLSLIVHASSISSRAKWIVSSRNWPSIERDLDNAAQKLRLSLELNETSVSAAIASYIRLKVDMLAKKARFEDNTRDAAQHYLLSNASGTFLWVALVCQELSKIPGWKVRKKLTAYPPGLDAFYRRMMDQINNLEADDIELCRQILAVVSTVYRPITLGELSCLVDMPDGASGDFETLSEIVALCGSLLAVRERTVAFVHQSAKDFLVQKAYNEIYPSKTEYVHYTVFSKSLRVMSQTLRRNIYNLTAPGLSIEEVKRPQPDPLSSARYSCVYWTDHLLSCDLSTDSAYDLQDGGSVHKFLLSYYLYWLEALSLIKELSKGVLMMSSLQSALDNVTNANLLSFIHDARRFLLKNRAILEEAPLQTYSSAMIFAPKNSLVRKTFEKETSQWIIRQPKVQNDWSASLQALEGHSDSVWAVAFSPDGKLVASASDDKTVRLWDTATGGCQSTLEGHSDWVSAVAFSPDGKLVASASDDKTVRLWDTATGGCQSKLKPDGYIVSLSFSDDGSFLITNIGQIRTGYSSRYASYQSPSPYFHVNEGWICGNNTRRILWLPPEFRPSSAASRGNDMILGCPSGSVLFLSLCYHFFNNSIS